MVQHQAVGAAVAIEVDVAFLVAGGLYRRAVATVVSLELQVPDDQVVDLLASLAADLGVKRPVGVRVDGGALLRPGEGVGAVDAGIQPC